MVYSLRATPAAAVQWSLVVGLHQAALEFRTIRDVLKIIRRPICAPSRAIRGAAAMFRVTAVAFSARDRRTNL